jgi:threonyl-tRNA synthetase
VGDRDIENGTLSVRRRTGEDLGAMSPEEFSALLHKVVDNKERD